MAVANNVLTQERSSLEVFSVSICGFTAKVASNEDTRTRQSSPSEDPSLQRELRHLLIGCLQLILLHSPVP